MMTPGSGMLFGTLWIVWLVVSIVFAVAFYRGMRALAMIPERLERIEAALLRSAGAARDETRM